MKNLLRVIFIVISIYLATGCTILATGRHVLNESKTKFSLNNAQVNFNGRKISLLNLVSDEFDSSQLTRIDSSFTAFADSFNLNIEIIHIENDSTYLLNEIKKSFYFNNEINNHVINDLLTRTKCDYLLLNYFTLFRPEVYSVDMVKINTGSPVYDVNGKVSSVYSSAFFSSTLDSDNSSVRVSEYKNGINSKNLIYNKAGLLNQIDLLRAYYISFLEKNDNNLDYLWIYNMIFFQEYYIKPVLNETIKEWNFSDDEYNLLARMFDKYIAIKYSGYYKEVENFKFELSADEYTKCKNLLGKLKMLGWHNGVTNNETRPLTHNKIEVVSYNVILSIFAFDTFIDLNF